MNVSDSRRVYLKAAACGFLLFRNAYLYAAQPLNVKDFGAKGDGVTDDYGALKRAFAALNEARTGVLVFPPGRYYIKKYRIKLDQLDEENITLKNCSNVIIDLQGSEVRVNGAIHRGADRKGKIGWISEINTVIPINLVNCSNITIKNGTLIGEARLMTRDSGTVEGACHGVRIANCHTITLDSLSINNFASDGLYIAGLYTQDSKKYGVSTNIVLKNVSFKGNARQGMSIVGARDVRCTECSFTEMGNTGGSYGGHSPMAGVDIEPTERPPVAGAMTGEIYFENCKFGDNEGFNFVASSPYTTDTVYCKSCLFYSTGGPSREGKTRCKVNPVVRRAVFDQCTFENVSVVPGYGLYKMAHMASIAISRSKFISKGMAGPLVSYLAKDPAPNWIIAESEFIIEQDERSSSASIALQGSGISFERNSVVVQNQAKRAYTVAVLRDGVVATSNKWERKGNDFSTKIYIKGDSVGVGDQIDNLRGLIIQQK